MRKSFAILAAAAGLALAAAEGQETPSAPDPAKPAERRVETPNGALTLALPEGWGARALKSGVALEPPGNPLDETIVAACEPFALASIDDGPKLEDLLARLRAGQLATFEEGRRPSRERLAVGKSAALVVTYRGTDDGGRPAALRISVLPADGRVAVLTARIPARRLEERAPALDAAVATFAFFPREEEKALAKRLVGRWRSAAAPGLIMGFLANGTFEEVRPAAGPKAGAAKGGEGNLLPPAPPSEDGGTYDVIGREVRLRFDDGRTRAFRVDAAEDQEFTSAGQKWTRVGE